MKCRRCGGQVWVNYLKERIIYDVERKHYRLNKDKRSSFKKLQKEVKDGSQNSR